MTPELKSLLAAAEAWAANDPDAQTAAELRDLLDRVRGAPGGQAPDPAALPDPAAELDLQDRFAGTLTFGTAGLRAALGAGPNRMNRVVVRRAAAGIAAYARQLDAGVPRAVIGYDARHNSKFFAEETAAIFTAAGLETFLLPSALPTPVLAYAVRALECEVGVMVTASHNPPQDNGYKVYLGGRAVAAEARGVQIVAPHDAGITACIAAVVDAGNITLADSGWNLLPESIEKDYVTAVAALACPATSRKLRIVLTPLHGVGGRTATAVLAAAGFTDVHLVEAQAEPDPDFPTVDFPNPEEPGVLDLALEAAVARGADLVIANDPDADRVALAAADPQDGTWRMLRGDEVGTLLGAARAKGLADETASQSSARGAQSDTQPGVVAASIVSSRLLGKVAAAAGLGYTTTLTGFKWIARVPGLAYGYEEALGYCAAPELVRDKDGISAGLLLAELAAEAKASGRTLFDLLDEVYLAHGLHASEQLSVRVEDLGELAIMMDRLRRDPPSSLAGSVVVEAQDLNEGSGSLPPTDALRYVGADSTRVIIRPSGTEPKLKCYLEVVVPVRTAQALPAAKATAAARLEAVLSELRERLGIPGAPAPVQPQRPVVKR